MFSNKQTLLAFVAAAATSTLLVGQITQVAAAPHSFDPDWCHAYLCDVWLCTDGDNAPNKDALKVSANQNLYHLLGNDCGDVVTEPLVKPVNLPADEQNEVYCPADHGLWLSTFKFEIWRSNWDMGEGEHVTAWNDTSRWSAATGLQAGNPQTGTASASRWPGASMFKAKCGVDNGRVKCSRGDENCKKLYDIRPTEQRQP